MTGVESEDVAKQKRERRIELAKIVLASIAVLGVVPLIAVAPGVMKIIEPFVRHKRRYRTPTYVAGVVGTLQRRGLIGVRREGGVAVARLTEKGERVLQKYRIKEAGQGRKRWDGKWRVVIFDIHETKRNRRDRIRHDIAHFGFLKLQQSVWVYPYDCEELVALLKADCHLGQELLYMTVEKIENDVWLKKRFHLS